MINQQRGNKDRILELLIASEKKYTVRQLAKEIEVSKSTIEYHLNNLLKEKQIKVKKEILSCRNGAQYLTRLFWV